MNKNKNKGKLFENYVCKEMMSIFDGSFIRSFTSGAYTGKSNNKRLQQLSQSQIQNNRGDIVPDDSLPKMVIECKAYKDFPFHRLLLNDEIKQLNTWIDQLNDSKTDEDTGLLIFKINNKGTFLCIENNPNYELPPHFCFYYYNGLQYIISQMTPFLLLNKSYIKQQCGENK